MRAQKEESPRRDIRVTDIQRGGKIRRQLLDEPAVFLAEVGKIRPVLMHAQVGDGAILVDGVDIQLAGAEGFELLIAEVSIRSGDFEESHAPKHAPLQIDVGIQIRHGPDIDQLNLLVRAADTVDTTETLNDAHRIPVDIVVDEIIASLQVLTF